MALDVAKAISTAKQFIGKLEYAESQFNTKQGFISRMTSLILLVEDDMDHAELVIRVMQEHQIANQVRHFQDGQSALDYLFRREEFENPEVSPRPHVVLLDLHLSRMDGIDVLRAIKECDELKFIPVVMLSTSCARKDVARAYHNHANSYLVKPLGYEEFRELIKDFCFYWLGNNIRPKIQK